MENLGAIWTSLNGRKKIAVLGATLVVFAAVLFMARGGGSGQMSLLYSGLDSRAAGGVITALEGQNAAYEVRGNAIYVATADRDRLRMSLAAEGLPSMGSQGYELLDQLSGFGTTSQMFDAAYWRAKEGELARTIQASPNIRSARVHISAASNRPFQTNSKPSAAVTVAPVGGTLTADQARALRYLVAAAVAGLSPNDVSVIDDMGGLISSGEDKANASGDDPRSEALKAKVERLLEPRVGYGNAVVEVAVDTISASETIVERSFDPASRVEISSEVEERNSTSESAGQGQVTVASNLPDGDAANGGDSSTSKNAETRRRTNYEVSETQREVTKGPGDIRRLTVAVLVNDVVTTAEDGTRTTSPRTPEELEVLRTLVASAVGYNEARGDVITLESMPFNGSTPAGSEAAAAPSMFAKLDVMQLAQMAILGIVALILGLFVVRPILTSGASAPNIIDENALALGNDGMAALPGVETPAMAPAVPNLPVPIDTTSDITPQEEETDPVARLSNLISERQDETLQVLQSWIEEPAAEQETA